MSTSAQSPIGVFDSGLGGLTVLKSLATQFPQENFLYLGDTARLPYGTKSPATIRKYSEQIMDFLAAHSVKAIVVACNSASSTLKESEWKGIPVYDVITPGAGLAVASSSTGRIGVLGTRATVASQVYDKKIKLLAPEAVVVSQACPLFVPLVEEGWTDDPVTNLIVYRYLQPLLVENIDTLVLGCTHYPLLSAVIKKIVGSGVTLLDSGSAVAEILKQDFASGKILAAGGVGGEPSSRGAAGSVGGASQLMRKVEVIMTDYSLHSEKLAESYLSPIPLTDIGDADLMS